MCQIKARYLFSALKYKDEEFGTEVALISGETSKRFFPVPFKGKGSL